MESDELDRYITEGSEISAESVDATSPTLTHTVIGPALHEAHRRRKQAVKIPIIASLNGITKGGWLDYAKQMEQAGADALELNIYYIPATPRAPASRWSSATSTWCRPSRGPCIIPVAVKLGPYFSSIANMAKKLDGAGADALVLFNRFYQPDYDLESLEVVPNLILSNSHDLLLRLHWVAVLYGKVKADMALTGGVHSAADVSSP